MLPKGDKIVNEKERKWCTASLDKQKCFQFSMAIKKSVEFFGNDLQLCTAVHGRRIIDTIFVKIGTFNAEYLVIKTVKQPGSCGEI